MISLTLLLALALSTTSPAGSDEHWRLVYQAGRVEAVDGALELKEGIPEDLKHLWYWSERTAPRKIEPDSLESFEPAETKERLQIRVISQERPPSQKRRVVAAPAPMWLEVPEDLLPTWPVPEEGSLRIRWDRKISWQLRAVEPGRGTWWTPLSQGRSRVTLAPLPAADFHLTVLSHDGEPVPGARVRMMESGLDRKAPSRYWATFHSDAGTITVPSLPDSEDVALLVSARDHVLTGLRGRPSTLPAKVVLDPGTTIRGRFITAHKEPIAGVGIEIEAWVADDFGIWGVRSAESDEHGKWEIPSVPPGKIAVRANAPDFVPYLIRMQAGPEGTDLGTIILEKSIAPKVEVVNPGGEPVAGAEVSIPGGEPVFTDAQGRAELPGVAATRPVEVTADAWGYGRITEKLRPPHPPVIVLRLRPMFVASGVFLEADGVPVTDGVVTATTGNYSIDRGIEAGGSFKLELEPGKDYHLKLTAATTAELRLDVAPGLPGEERYLGELRAPESHVVVGRLISRVDGAPVPAARIWLARPSETDPLAAWFTGNLLEARSDHTGAFTIKGLITAPARLHIDAGGFGRRSLDIRPKPEIRELDLGDIELVPGVTVRVLVGEAMESGAVARLDLGKQWLEMDMLTARINDGVAIIRDVPPGEVILTVMGRGALLCEKSLTVPEEEQIEVECRARSMRVSGVVRLGGYAVGPGQLSWLPPALESMAIIDKRKTSGGLMQYSVFGAGRPQVDVEVAPDGFFTTDMLRPGSWKVVWSSPSGGSTEAMNMELPDLEELEVMVDFPGRTITGFVIDREEQPIEGARVRELSSGATVFSAVDGGFRLLGMKVGSRYLRADRDGESSAVTEVRVLPDEDPEPVYVVFGEEDTSGELAVMVLGEDAGIPGAFVFVEANGGQRILTTDSRGGATMSFDPPFPTQLRFAAYAGGRWNFGSWMRWEEARQEPLVLSFGETGSLALTSESAGGAVALRSPEGWNIAWLMTRLGLRPMIEPNRPLVIAGLPEGTYEVGIGEETAVFSVRGSRETRALLPE